VSKAWVGVDAGKGQHWALVIDVEGQTLRSRPVANDQTAISELLAEVSGLAEELVWAVDLSNGCSALLLALLWTNHPAGRLRAGPGGQSGRGRLST